MAIKTTNRVMVDAFPGIEALKKVPFPKEKARLAYRVGKLIAAVTTEMAAFEFARDKLVQAHAAKTSQGVTAERFVPVDVEAWKKDVEALADEPVEIATDPIPYEEIADLPLLAGEWAVLGIFIKE